MNKSTTATTATPLTSSASHSRTGDSSIVEQAKDTVSSVASQAKESAFERIEEQKEKAVERIEGVSNAIRGAGEKLEGTSDLARRAAEGIDRVAHYLENRSAADLIRGVEGFARREPALFLGGAMVLGIGLGRFLKSSSQRTSAARTAFGGDMSDRYETYGYEGDYADDFAPEDDFEDDWELSSEARADEPMAFEADVAREAPGAPGTARTGFSASGASSAGATSAGDSGSAGGVREGVGNVIAEQPLRAAQIGRSTQPHGAFDIGSGPSSKPGQA